MQPETPSPAQNATPPRCRLRGRTSASRKCNVCVKEFLVLHYVAAARQDNAYWRDAKHRPVPEGLRDRLRTAQTHLLDEETIYPRYHGFESYSWNTMLIGLGSAPRKARPVLAHLDSTAARAAFDRVAREGAEMVETLPSCYEYLASINRQIEP
jgi:hypothetical protein